MGEGNKGTAHWKRQPMNTPRILFASPNLPVPTTHGGSQRTALLLKCLETMGNVDCIFLPAEIPPDDLLLQVRRTTNLLQVESSDRMRQQYSSTTKLIPSEALQSFISADRYRWSPYKPLLKFLPDLSAYDLVVSRYLSSACILDLFRHPCLLIDVDDYDPDRIGQRIKHSSWLRNLTLRRRLKYSAKAHLTKLPKAQSHFVSNPCDKKHIGLENAFYLPNIPFFENQQLPVARQLNPGSKDFLMVGSLSYSPNADGLEHFLDRAWPHVLNHEPRATLTVVGGGLSKRRGRNLSRVKGVRLKGFLQDLDSSYNNCLATICPILAGGGTNIKVLESAAYSRAPILSKVAHRGLEKDFKDGRHCLVSNSIECMAELCIKLLEDAQLASTIGSQARTVIERNYCFEQFDQVVHSAVMRILQNANPPLREVAKASTLESSI